MFETAELGRELDKQAYESQVAALRTELLRLQRAVATAARPVYLLIHGVDGSGRGDVLNLLHEWLDARYLDTFALSDPTEEERQRPPYWRYWMHCPARGRIGVFFGSWHSQPIVRRVYGEINDAELEMALARATAFERALVEDGAVVIKLWLHISRAQQKKRYKRIEADRKAPWPVTKQDWKNHALYSEFRRVATRTLRLTSLPQAPWTVIEAGDARYRDIEVARQLVEQLGRGLAEPTAAGSPPLAMPPSAPDPAGPAAQSPEQRPPESPDPPTAHNAASSNAQGPATILDTLDLTQSLSRNEYDERLVRAQARLNRLARKMGKKQTAAVIVLQGWDAAGKGGAIRRVAHALDARNYRVVPIAAPSDEERAHHYLWRFWRHLPRLGRTTIFDRSWYERVLVERVEGFATEPEWRRAYGEINDFEEQLVEFGIVLVKYWLHISPDEQLRRFKEREGVPWKRHKITAEDYRNREKWPAYERAVADMIERTSTEYAPWTLVEGNDKHFARVKVVETFLDRLEHAL
ncbi:MAG: polyphosphate:AMP phosphotransferase [Polyangiaceae bacterium]|nr:polyphosphate:AMP phosphotransferase [Polyangiaceae bacterium]